MKFSKKIANFKQSPNGRKCAQSGHPVSSPVEKNSPFRLAVMIF
jgi:hypothetical protein